jgi:hypothetical protein
MRPNRSYVIEAGNVGEVLAKHGAARWVNLYLGNTLHALPLKRQIEPADASEQ